MGHLFYTPKPCPNCNYRDLETGGHQFGPGWWHCIKCNQNYDHKRTEYPQYDDPKFKGDWKCDFKCNECDGDMQQSLNPNKFKYKQCDKCYYGKMFKT